MQASPHPAQPHLRRVAKAQAAPAAPQQQALAGHRLHGLKVGRAGAQRRRRRAPRLAQAARRAGVEEDARRGGGQRHGKLHSRDAAAHACWRRTVCCRRCRRRGQGEQEDDAWVQQRVQPLAGLPGVGRPKGLAHAPKAGRLRGAPKHHAAVRELRRRGRVPGGMQPERCSNGVAPAAALDATSNACAAAARFAPAAASCRAPPPGAGAAGGRQTAGGSRARGSRGQCPAAAPAPRPCSAARQRLAAAVGG